MIRAVSSRILLPERAAGPGRVNHALGAAGRSSADQRDDDVVDRDRSACVTSTSAAGHYGRRAARSRDDEPVRLPKPTIMLARSSIVSTGPARSARPRRAELRRCSEASAAPSEARRRRGTRSGPRPPGRPLPRRSRRPLARARVVGASPVPVHEVERRACNPRARVRTRPDRPRRPGPSRSRARSTSARGLRSRAAPRSGVRQPARASPPAPALAARPAGRTRVAPVSGPIGRRSSTVPPVADVDHGSSLQRLCARKRQSFDPPLVFASVKEGDMEDSEG
jgi:hypothetical protein